MEAVVSLLDLWYFETLHKLVYTISELVLALIAVQVHWRREGEDTPTFSFDLAYFYTLFMKKKIIAI